MSAGVLAVFSTEAAWGEARERLLAAGIDGFKTYTPTPPAGSREDSALPGLTAAAGILGALGGFGMQYYAAAIAYPIDIGGRPAFSWPSFVPIAFEIGALCAVLTAVVGFFVANRLPRLYDPIDACEGMRGAMHSDWVIAVRCAETARFELVRRILTACQARSLEDMEA